MALYLPPIVGATVPKTMTFKERVFWYSMWIENWPMSHIHFVDSEGKTMFISECGKK